MAGENHKWHRRSRKGGGGKSVPQSVRTARIAASVTLDRERRRTGRDGPPLVPVEA